MTQREKGYKWLTTNRKMRRALLYSSSEANTPSQQD